MHLGLCVRQETKPQNKEKLSTARSCVGNREARRQGKEVKQSRSASENQKSRRRRSRGCLTERSGVPRPKVKKENKNEIESRGTTFSRRSLASTSHTVVSHRYDFRHHVGGRTNPHRFKKVMKGLRWHGIPHRLCGIRVTALGSTS